MSASDTRDSAEKAPSLHEQAQPGTPDTQHSEHEVIYSYGYLPEMWDHEDLDQYRPGGLHPIIIGDTLGNNGRYKVVRKLGAGGVATVWLCRDQKDEKWVAVKVLGANASLDAAQCQSGEMAVLKHFRDLEVDEAELADNHVCLPDDYFIEEGPNGSHFCFILPLLAGDIRGAWIDYGYKPEVLREICAQMVIAMNYLHSKGVCHGDFRPANILYTVKGIEKASEDEINEMFPEGEEEELGPIPATGEEPGPHVPKFIYSSTCLQRQLEQDNVNIVISDFGEAYLVDNSPGYLGIPVRHAAPEVILNPGLGFGFATDIWSLGTSIMEVRHNTQLVIDMSEIDAVECLEAMFGPLPEPYRSIWFASGYRGHWDTRDASEIASTENVAYVPRINQKGQAIKYWSSLEDKIREPRRLGVRMEPGEDLSKKPGQTPVGDGFVKWIEYQIPEKEADQVFDLLSRIIKYSPAERLSVKEVMAHPWFSDRFSTCEMEDVDMDRVVEQKVPEVVDEVVGETPAVKAVIDYDTAQKPAAICVPEDSDVQMTENEHIQAPVKAADEEYEHETMTDGQACPTPFETESKEGNEVFYDAVDTPVATVPPGRIARIYARLRVMFFPTTWRLGGKCFGA